MSYLIFYPEGSGDGPGTASNLTLSQEAGGWVLRWIGPKEDTDIRYYTIQIKQDSQVATFYQKVFMFKNLSSINILQFQMNMNTTLFFKLFFAFKG